MKSYKPTTSSQRHTKTPSYGKYLTVSEPTKKLTKGRKRSAGRNNAGHITTRHRGGGHKRLFRDIDFKYDKRDIPAKVETIEYDPNRSGFIACIVFTDGERRYILAPKSVSVGDTIVTAEKAEIKPGNRMRLKNVPVGSFVYNIELKPDAGARIARSAGSNAEVVANDEGYTQLKMPSGEMRKIIDTAFASIGEVSNDEHKLRVIGKAGRSRWLGKRPRVRGSAMGAHDHPHGGGEGRAGRGHRRQRTKWGKLAGKGQKTRRKNKYSDNLIVSRRKVGKKRR